MLKSSQNIWILEKQNTAEVAGRRRAREAISSDSLGDKGRAMTVYVLIRVELPPWCCHPRISLALAVMPHLAVPQTSVLSHSQAGCIHRRSQQDLLPSPPWGTTLSSVGLVNWAARPRVGIPITAACFAIKTLFSLLWALPSSPVKNQAKVTISITMALELRSPVGSKDGRENIGKLFCWGQLLGPGTPSSSAGCCKHTVRDDPAFLAGSFQGKRYYLHGCNSPGSGRRQRVQCHQMRIKLHTVPQNVN